MNILITSAGRRTKLVDYFKNELHGNGKVITADASKLAPALYTGDKGYLVPNIADSGYLESIIDICLKENVSAVVSLIDPELPVLAGHRKRFQDIGVQLVLPDYDAVSVCNDKTKMHDFIRHHHYDTFQQYDNIADFLEKYETGEASLPVFVKKRFGSASSGAKKVTSVKSLESVFDEEQDLFIQEFIEGRELGIDIYVDLISRDVVSVFVKEKFHMRAGETDKAVSVIEPAVDELVSDFVRRLQLTGPLDMDIIERDNRRYIIDVNCRFGGGYPLAYACGENFPSYIIQNIMGESNPVKRGAYPAGIKMLKHDDVVIVGL